LTFFVADDPECKWNQHAFSMEFVDFKDAFKCVGLIYEESLAFFPLLYNLLLINFTAIVYNMYLFLFAEYENWETIYKFKNYIFSVIIFCTHQRRLHHIAFISDLKQENKYKKQNIKKLSKQCYKINIYTKIR
jgi:hypothetical protein